MTNKDNQTGVKQYYLTISGQNIPVSEEIYRVYKQPLWKERKQFDRKRRCQVSAGRGGLKRCEADCNLCPHTCNGSELSLEAFEADWSYQADASAADPQQMLEDALLLEEMWTAIASLDSVNQMIVKLFWEGESERKIATVLGLSQKGVNKRKVKLFEQMRKRLKDFQ